MTYPHTPKGTGKRLGTIEERLARLYFRPNSGKHLEKNPSVETFGGMPRGGPVYAATGVPRLPTTRVTYQCARVTLGRRISAVTAGGEL